MISAHPRSRFQSSHGLIIDLGFQIQSSNLQAIYNFIWQQPELKEAIPQEAFGNILGVPKATQGKLALSPHTHGSCYTKLESDSMGYPSSIPVPLLLTLSLHHMNRRSNRKTTNFLTKLCQPLFQVFPYRLAVLGDVTTFFINADLVSPQWLDWQSLYLNSIYLAPSHSLSNSIAGKSLANGLQYYSVQTIRKFISDQTDNQKYKIFKEWMNKRTQTDLIRIG